MPTWLEQIIEKKRTRIEKAKRDIPLAKIMRDLTTVPNVRRSFRNKIAEAGISLIAEVKRASPSAGNINERCNPVDQARAYFEGGARAISVLTEEDFFKGDLEDLEAVKFGIPVAALRKDFIVDAYQIYESALSNADAILLIAAALSPGELTRFIELAGTLAIDCLVEVHDMEDTEKIRDVPVSIVGVNNRNLKTLKVDLEQSVRLFPHLPPKALKIAESGITRREEVVRLEALGYDAILVGESLMRSNNPVLAVRNLLGVENGEN